MAAPVKSQTVLELFSGTIIGGAIFRHPDRHEQRENRTEHVCREFSMTHRDWVDMGKPDQITITIEPGDKLNG